MRQAPSVSFVLGRCAPLAVMLVVAGLLPVVQGLIWWSTLSSLSGQRPLVALVLVFGWLWAMWAWRVWARWPQGQLSWVPARPGLDAPGAADQWRWIDAHSGREQVLQGIEVALDLQGHAFLRLRLAQGAPLWACASRSADPARWLALRRAWTAASG